jgi:hypothetical protein
MIETAINVHAATYYMATAMSDYGLPTYKFLFNAGSQLHGADGPFLWGPPECEYSCMQ